MTFTDPLAGRWGASGREIAEAARVWDAYDSERDGPEPMPFFYTTDRYENWWGSGVPIEQLHHLAKSHGIPVAWVPQPFVLRELAASGSRHDDKLRVLEAHEDDIRRMCHQVVSECTSDWLEETPEPAEKAVAAWADGHLQAAACLALAGAEDLMFYIARVSREDKYKGLKEAASADLRFSWMTHHQVALAPIDPLFARYFPEKNDPVPELLSRHAVLHRLPLEHLNTGHSIIAVMLLVSLLRQAEQRARWIEEDTHTEGADFD